MTELRKRKISVAAARLTPLLMMGCILLAGACSNDECLDNKNSLPLAGFYSSDEKPQAISLDSLTILGIGAPGDSVLHDSVRSLSQTYLPFRIDQEETTYEIRYLSGDFGLYHITDRITFKYEIQPWFVSQACGVVYNYKIKSITWTDNVIDSVTCPTGVINNADIENIKIYFRVRLQEEGGEE